MGSLRENSCIYEESHLPLPQGDSVASWKRVRLFPPVLRQLSHPTRVIFMYLFIFIFFFLLTFAGCLSTERGFCTSDLPLKCVRCAGKNKALLHAEQKTWKWSNGLLSLLQPDSTTESRRDAAQDLHGQTQSRAANWAQTS